MINLQRKPWLLYSYVSLLTHILLTITLSGRFAFPFPIRSSCCIVDSEVIVKRSFYYLLGACELQVAQVSPKKEGCLVTFVRPPNKLPSTRTITLKLLPID